jgi:hypothetical protein
MIMCRQELTELQMKSEEGTKSGSEELNKLRQQLAKAQADLKLKETTDTTSAEEIKRLKSNLNSVRNLGRKFREQFMKSEEEKAALQKEKEALEAAAANKPAAPTPPTDEGLLLIEELSNEHEKLKVKYDELMKKQEELSKKESKAKDVMKIARDKIDTLKAEKAELEEKLKEQQRQGEVPSEIDNMKSAALVSQGWNSFEQHF